MPERQITEEQEKQIVAWAKEKRSMPIYSNGFRATTPNFFQVFLVDNEVLMLGNWIQVVEVPSDSEERKFELDHTLQGPFLAGGYKHFFDLQQAGIIDLQEELPLKRTTINERIAGEFRLHLGGN